MNELIPIGEVARLSGLSVSALRFYDGAGVLRPEAVDPVTGYRRYATAQVRVARLVAGLRRIGLPIAEIREAVERADDPELVSGLLDAHLERLESGLTDARREIGRIRTTFVESAQPASATVTATDVLRLLEAVSFATSEDPAIPILTGVLVEIAPDTIRMVATDRFRLAVHEVPAATDHRAAGVLPAAAVDSLRRLATDALAAAGGDVSTGRGQDGPLQVAVVEIRLSAGGLHVSTTHGAASLPVLDGDFPDYRRLVDGRRAAAGPAEFAWDESLLRVGVPDPDLATLDSTDEPVVVRHEFLMEALAAAGSSASLQLDGAIAPLAIRAPDGALSLLMPTRQEATS